MTTEIAGVYGLVGFALVLFAWDRIRVDAAAILIMVILMVSDLLEPRAALSGFSNPATVTVGAMFVLSEGLRQTGALTEVGQALADLGRRNQWLALVGMMLTVGVVSGFINNTAAVAIFLPVVIQLAEDLEVSPSQLLMPLSFASMFGGVTTLIGTSTNLLVSSIAEDHGMARFQMFELAPLGLTLFAFGFAFLLLAYPYLPARRPPGREGLGESYGVAPYLGQLELSAGAECVGQPLRANCLTQAHDLEIVGLVRDGQPLPARDREFRLREGDTLVVRLDTGELEDLVAEPGVSLKGAQGETFDVEELQGEFQTLAEAVVTAESDLAGMTVQELGAPGRLGGHVLAVRRSGRVTHDLRDVKLRGGDSVLLMVDRENLAELRDQLDLLIVSEIVIPQVRERRMPFALAIVATVVALAALDVAPIVVTAIAGCLAMLATGVLTAEEVYGSINWKVLFLLAGVLPLGVAMETTGAAQLLADSVVQWTSSFGPAAVLSAFFLVTQLLTGLISNNAAGVLMAPIAIGTADQLGVDARPFLIAITVAASMSFVTPIGYQTNTMIYGPGHYRFTDFTKVGLPLTLLVWVVASVAIPWLWPL